MSSSAAPSNSLYAFDIGAALAAESRGRPAASAAAPGAAAGAPKDAAAKGATAAAPAGGKKDAAAAKPAAAAGGAAASAPAAGAKGAAAAGGEKEKKDKPAKEKAAKPAAAAASSGEEVSQVYRVDFRVGSVLSVAAHPSEARLYVLQVACGDEGGAPRQVVSGLAEHFTPAQLTGARIVLMINCAPGDIKGAASAGRIMVATSADGKKKELATPPAAAAIGERVSFPGVTTQPDAPIAPKRLHEILKHLKTNAEGVVSYGDKPFTTSAGVVTVPSIKDGVVA